MSSRPRILLLATAVAAFIALGPLVLGQVTTGSLSGVVTDQEGASLPGAQVEALHGPTGTRYSAVTREDGRFAIPNVRVGGPYTVTVTMDGFQPQEVTDSVVALGEDLRLTFQLQLEGVEETVFVVAESNPLLNPSKTGASGNVYKEALENLPTISRGLEDFARTNPFFTVASANEDPESISVAGRNSRYNNISIDGSVNNDLFGLAATGTPGGQSGTTPISLDAIQELQLVLASFDVRQGGFSGGGINAITRSGSNDWEGSIFYYTRDDGFFGDGPEELGEFGTFEEEQYGFRLGGPIVKDKIFFFVNADIEESTTPTGWSIDGSTGQRFGFVEEAQRFRNILLDQYGYDPGGLGENLSDIPSDKYFARLDFNLNQSHNLTLRHNFVDAQNDINRPGSTVYEFPSETYAFTTETNSTVLQLNSVFSPTLFNELRLANQTIRDRRNRRDGPPFPWIEIENVVPGNRREFEAGTEPFSTFNSLDQDIIELTNDVTWLRGDHTFTFGTHNEFFTFDNLFVSNGFGAYEFNTLDDFAAGNARRFQYSFANPGQNPSAVFDVNQLGFYASDQWAINPRLNLTFGLRLDVPYFPDEPTRNPLTEQAFGFRTDDIPNGEMLWSPRFGFNWDIRGNGKEQLRGGAGIFSGRTPYVWISNQYTNNGIVLTNLTALNVPFNPDPFNQPTTIGGASTQEVNLIDPDFEFPQLLRINLAYDRELPWWGLIGTAELIFADSQNEIDYRNLNLEPTGATQPFDGRPLFRTVTNQFGGAFLITNTDKGEATNFALKLERPYQDGIWGYVSYAYGDSKVINDGTSSRAVSNWQFNEAVDPNNAPESTSDFEVEHRFNASLSYQFNRHSRFPTTVSAYYNLQSGRPYSVIYTSSFPSINNDTFGSNDLLYVPATRDDVIITNGTWEQLDAYISADEGLNSHRGGIVPRNASVGPWNHTLDLHIAQQIPIRGTNLEVTFDILNLMNLIDEDSGVFRFANFEALAPVTFVGVDAPTGKPIYALDATVRDPANNDKFDIHNTRSRWQAKLGLRFSF